MPKRQSVNWLTRAACAATALLILAWLYETWVRLPIDESRSLGVAYLEGAVGAMVCGAILGFGVRHLIDAGLVACGAILVGHAWALQHTSDTTVSFRNALEETVPQLLRFHVLLVALLLAGWGTVSFLAARRARGEAKCDDAVER